MRNSSPTMETVVGPADADTDPRVAASSRASRWRKEIMARAYLGRATVNNPAPGIVPGAMERDRSRGMSKDDGENQFAATALATVYCFPD